jgi:putative Holliday junction resolvase
MAARVLAIDYGRKRIGLAMCDALGITATGLPTLFVTTIRESLDRLAKLAAEREAELLLVGDPRNMDGSAGPASKEAREFGRKLARLTGLPIVYYDERLTSLEAEAMLRDRDSHGERRGAAAGSRRPGEVDQAAAVVLLRDYLLSRENQG